jgi:hypothetical protein
MKNSTSDPTLEILGTTEKQAGKVEQWIGHGEKAVGE